MPCDTITRVRLELKQANFALLKKAVMASTGQGVSLNEKDGIMVWYGGSYNRKTGELTVRSEEQGKQIKKAYSTEVLHSQAKRFGWQVKQVAQDKYQIIKR